MPVPWLERSHRQVKRAGAVRKFPVLFQKSPLKLEVGRTRFSVQRCPATVSRPAQTSERGQLDGLALHAREARDK